MYEGYGPHGVAVIISCFTENKNRTVAELRHNLSRLGGSLAESGSVSWQFKQTSYFAISAAGKNFDKIFELAVDGGADDVVTDDETIEIFAPVQNFKIMLDALRKANLTPSEADLRMIPTQEVELEVDGTLQLLRLVESLEELDDVQNVYSNLHISDAAIAAIEAA